MTDENATEKSQTLDISKTCPACHGEKWTDFFVSRDVPVDVGSASVNFFMPAMGSMSAMNNPATLTTTGTPGIYRANADIEMTGEWQAQVSFDGPAGKGKGSIPVTAQ